FVPLNDSTGLIKSLRAGTNVTFAVTDTTITINATSTATSPAGSNTQIQYNNSGSFGAEAAFTYNATNNLLTVDSLRNIRSQTDTILIGAFQAIRPLTMRNTSGGAFI